MTDDDAGEEALARWLGESDQSMGQTDAGSVRRPFEGSVGGPRDRICYLYDYGDEWRFYAILEEIVDDEPDGRSPEVVEARGEAIEQYTTDR